MVAISEFVRLQADVGLVPHEYLLGLAARPMLQRASLKAGDGRPVLLLPGFGANEALLKPLNGFLRANGYESEMFIPGFPQDESLESFITELSHELSIKVRGLKRRTGKPVSLVGQSAGGLYSREFARRYPAGIDRVITLGSPTFSPENLHLQNKALNALIKRRFGTSAETAFGKDRFVHWGKDQPTIPYVAIYSPIDGAVKAETVVIPKSQLNTNSRNANRENIAINSSHFGMILNPFVMLAVVDRLGVRSEQWQAFEPHQYLPASLRKLSSLAYPSRKPDFRTSATRRSHPEQPSGRDARERVISTLRTEHENIEKLLASLHEEVGKSARSASGLPNYAVVSGILGYLHHYTDGFHHPREDLLFDRLIKREQKLEPVITTLFEDHSWIETESELLIQTLDHHRASKRAAQRNKSLDAKCRRYIKRLRSHLQHEETTVFVHLDLLHPHDWVAVDKGLDYQPDPLFGKKVQQGYEELADALSQRVEGIGESVALSNVLGLEALANGVDALVQAFRATRQKIPSHS